MPNSPLLKELKIISNPQRAKDCQRFFKTGSGEYGEGDIFLGIPSPVLRKMAKENWEHPLSTLDSLIKSKYHEARLLGLLILVNKYAKCKKDEEEKERIYQLYLKSFPFINNWDLVDVTCPHLIGKHLMTRDRRILVEWAKSDDLWIKRIAMVSNWWLIRKGDLKEVFKIAKILLLDEHDLIHKAVGWMLREAAKKDLSKTEEFLKKHYHKMPRTMLRYAIERFPEVKRQKYLKGKM